MENAILPVWNVLSDTASRAVDGLHDLGATIGVKQNTEIVVSGELAATKLTQAAYQSSKVDHLNAVSDQTVCDKAGQEFLRTARDAFKIQLGSRFSQAWNEVGFLNHSLAIPRTLAGRVTLLDTMHSYLVAHPEMEAASLSVTAAQALDLFTSLRDKIKGVAEADANQENLRNARDAAVSALCKRLRNLVKELAGLLGPLDPRWKRFGFNEPGDMSAPLPPDGLEVVPGLPQQLQMHWNWTPGAARFHIYQMIVGTDPQYVFIKTTTDTQALLNHYASGTHVRLRLTAVNAAGESLPCEPVEVVVP